MSAYEDIFGKPFDKDDPFGMKSMEASFRKMEDERVVAQYKRQKKEPIERRRDLLRDAHRELCLSEAKGVLLQLDANRISAKFADEKLAKQLEKLDEEFAPVEEYYAKMLKEIDDMKLKVVRKSEEP